MNERIRELARQAEEYALSVCDNNGHFHRIYREKLAELIVQECLHIVDDEGAGEGGCIRAMIRIQEELGVEE